MSEAEALARARSVAEVHGWPFLDPISVVFRKRWFRRGGKWTIHTRINSMDGHVGMVIDDQTGAVMEKRYASLPR